jgi:sec-independent protein translocase protein TatB
MFDIGFAELLIIGVVGLLVIGPERLPETVRTVTAWASRLRRSFDEIKTEVQQELRNDEIMRELRETGDQLRQETEQFRQGAEHLGRELDQARDEVGETPEDQAGEPEEQKRDSA